MTIDLDLLTAFEAMLLHQSVTAAAAQVGLTQSAMSNAIGRLRRHFGDPLFVKTREGMLPTARALELAVPLKQALALVRNSTHGRAAFDPSESKRVFRFYMPDVGEMVFLPRLMKSIKDLGATIRIETTQFDSAQISQRLSSGEIDLAVGYLSGLGKDVGRLPLFREDYVCMTSREYPLSDNRSLTMKEFRNASHVLVASMGSGHRIIEQTLRRRGIQRNVHLRVSHFLAVPMIVASAQLIVTLPRRVAMAYSDFATIRVHPLPIRIPSFEVAVFWHRRFADDPAIAWMRSQMSLLFRTSSPKEQPES